MLEKRNMYRGTNGEFFMGRCLGINWQDLETVKSYADKILEIMREYENKGNIITYQPLNPNPFTFKFKEPDPEILQKPPEKMEEKGEG